MVIFVALPIQFQLCQIFHLLHNPKTFMRTFNLSEVRHIILARTGVWGWNGPSCSYPIQGATVQIRSHVVWVDTATHQSRLLGEWSSAGCPNGCLSQVPLFTVSPAYRWQTVLDGAAQCWCEQNMVIWPSSCILLFKKARFNLYGVVWLGKGPFFSPLLLI